MFELLSTESLRDELKDSLDRLDDKQNKILARSPLPAEFTSTLERKLEVELTHGSISIEGNTLTLRETQLLIEEGIAPATAKELREIYEAVNHHDALQKLRWFVLHGNSIDEDAICHLHSKIMARIDDERAGKYRQHTVLVTGAPLQPMRAEKVGAAMLELQNWLEDADCKHALHPVLVASEAHYRFVKIHPFYDGNGRSARLLMNWILLRGKYPLAVIPGTARSRYLHALDDADRGKPDDFFKLVIECVEGSVDQYLSGL